MKKFEDICRMTQQEVKSYMKKYLMSKKYKVVDEDGFLYAKGNIPVLLVAHMDTVHKEQCKDVICHDEKICSPQGIGGDDRCGIFIIANLVKSLHCSVLLCEDEESGGIGARKFTKTDYINNLDVNYMIEFDRAGNNDAVFYSCDNQDFMDYVVDTTGYKKAYGSFSDISILMPASKLCAVNLSSGYHNAHTTNEYVVFAEMMDTVRAAKTLIETECTAPYEYVAKTYSWKNSYSWDSYSWGSRNDDDDYSDLKPLTISERAKKDITLELEVYIKNEYGREDVLYETGETKAECWLNLFASNPHLCFDDITDYSFI